MPLHGSAHTHYMTVNKRNVHISIYLSKNRSLLNDKLSMPMQYNHERNLHNSQPFKIKLILDTVKLSDAIYSSHHL